MRRGFARRAVLLLVTSMVAPAAIVLAVAGPAQAACGDVIVNPDGSTGVDYTNCEGQPGGDDDDTPADTGGGGGVEPTCEFSGIWDDFCRGSKPCYVFDPAALQDADYARENDYPDLPEKPSEDDYMIFESCLLPNGDREDAYFWSSEFEQGVSTRDRLLAAFGALVVPEVTPTFNPPARTLVNLDTWWWAEGASADPIVGSEALGLVAIAEPRSMIVTAGGQTVTCPVLDSKSDECVLVFRRSGDYTATMQIAYDVRFEIDGAPFDVPGGNDDLLTVSSSDTVPVPVLEVQSRVTQLG